MSSMHFSKKMGRLKLFGGQNKLRSRQARVDENYRQEGGLDTRVVLLSC